jgi:hypothetical protein
MGAGDAISDAEFRAIGVRLKAAFEAAGIPAAAQGPAADACRARPAAATWSSRWMRRHL